MRNLIAAVERIDPLTVSGRVAAINGLLIEARGGLTRLPIGARADIERPHLDPLPAEVGHEIERPLTNSASSALVTSSNRITSGSIAKALAIATRCCCPPERPARR